MKVFLKYGVTFFLTRIMTIFKQRYTIHYLICFRQSFLKILSSITQFLHSAMSFFNKFISKHDIFVYLTKSVGKFKVITIIIKVISIFLSELVEILLIILGSFLLCLCILSSGHRILARGLKVFLYVFPNIFLTVQVALSYA